MNTTYLIAGTAIVGTATLLIACQTQDEATDQTTAQTATSTLTTSSGNDQSSSSTAVDKKTTQAAKPAPPEDTVAAAVIHQPATKKTAVTKAKPAQQTMTTTTASTTKQPKTVVEPVSIPKGPPIVIVPLDDVTFLATDIDSENGFAGNAFPPTIPDTDWHREAWKVDKCIRCHETGVVNAPMVKHETLPDILMQANCRTCHVIEPGKAGVMAYDQTKLVSPTTDAPNDRLEIFNDNAFPPMIPNSKWHTNTWTIKDCLMCHGDGTMGAPIVKHEGLPAMLLQAKCRTCHVQVRAILSDRE